MYLEALELDKFEDYLKQVLGKEIAKSKDLGMLRYKDRGKDLA